MECAIMKFESIFTLFSPLLFTCFERPVKVVYAVHKSHLDPLPNSCVVQSYSFSQGPKYLTFFFSLLRESFEITLENSIGGNALSRSEIKRTRDVR